jgi:hypothetical protein
MQIGDDWMPEGGFLIFIGYAFVMVLS